MVEVTLAAPHKPRVRIVEKETALPAERPRIAAIFVNRLDDDVHANTVCCDHAIADI